jgi:hypothetical protein
MVTTFVHFFVAGGVVEEFSCVKEITISFIFLPVEASIL